MAPSASIIAVIFDFDDTLAPDSTSKLLKHFGIDDKEFWTVHTKALVQRGYDPALAFLRLLLDNVGSRKKLGQLTNAQLSTFGARVDSDFFPGIPDIFIDLKNIPKKYKNIEVEFYIISGGLQSLIEGSKLVREHFKAVYGCQLEGDPPDGPLRYIKRCVTFTEKTRYMFEINKGLEQDETQSNPVLVNKPLDVSKRRVPFSNMIYVGDGLTDVPCFSLLKEKKGLAFGVFDPKRETSAKQALQQFLRPARVISVHSPDYRESADLGALIRAAVSTKCSQILLERQLAEGLE